MGEKDNKITAYDEKRVSVVSENAYILVEENNLPIVEKAFVTCNQSVAFADQKIKICVSAESNNVTNGASGLRESDIALKPERFGLCYVTEEQCEPEIEGKKWQACDQTHRINGEASVTMNSYMVCLKGGIIAPLTDGQRIEELMEQYFAKYVSLEQLEKLGWHNADEKMVIELNRVLEKYDITTTERIRHFLAQCMKESNRGAGTREGDYINWESQESYEEYYDKNTQYGYKYRGAGYIQITHEYNYLAFATYMIQQEYPELNVEWKTPAHNTLDKIQGNFDEVVKKAKGAGKDIVKYEKIVSEGADYVAQEYAWEVSGYDWHEKELNLKVDMLTPGDKMGVDQVSRVINQYDTETYEERRNYYEETMEIIK